MGDWGLFLMMNRIVADERRVPEPTAKGTIEVSEDGSNSVGTDEGYERSSRGEAVPTEIQDV